MNPHSTAAAADAARSICILAAKDLRTNTRVARQALALRLAGWQVTVAALELPQLDDATIDGVRIGIGHPLQALTGGSAGANAPASQARRRGWRQLLAGIARRLALPFGHTINSLRFRRGVMRQLRGRAFDLVQAHDAPALRAAQALAHHAGSRLVYDAVEYVDSRATFLNGALARAVRRAESACEARLVRRAATCFAIGPCMAGWMKRRYGIAAPVVVRNCRLLETPGEDARLRQAAGLDADAAIVLYVNTIYPGRGLEVLLEAMTRLEPRTHLVILGDPGHSDYAVALRQHAARVGLATRLHFVPPRPPAELVAWASGADVGVIPFQNTSMNHYYALPNRLFEMIMARVPVAASAFPEMQALIEDHAIGATFDPESADSIAAALAELLDPASRASLRQRLDIAAQDLNWERESAAYLATLDALAGADARR